jgi:RNA polymerase sigma-70 factor (ECF subfamily)
MPVTSDARTQFEALATTDRERLVALAQRFVREPHEAEDVVQDTLTAIWQRLDAAPPDNLAAYATRAVELNALKRAQRRRRHASLDETPEPAAKVDWKADAYELEQAIAKLPVLQQAAIRTRYYTGLSFKQMARALEIPQNTAASRCRYALAALRASLASGGKREPEQGD